MKRKAGTALNGDDKRPKTERQDFELHRTYDSILHNPYKTRDVVNLKFSEAQKLEFIVQQFENDLKENRVLQSVVKQIFTGECTNALCWCPGTCHAKVLHKVVTARDLHKADSWTTKQGGTHKAFIDTISNCYVGRAGTPIRVPAIDVPDFKSAISIAREREELALETALVENCISATVFKQERNLQIRRGKERLKAL